MLELPELRDALLREAERFLAAPAVFFSAAARRLAIATPAAVAAAAPTTAATTPAVRELESELSAFLALWRVVEEREEEEEDFDDMGK